MHTFEMYAVKRVPQDEAASNDVVDEAAGIFGISPLKPEGLRKQAGHISEPLRPPLP